MLERLQGYPVLMIGLLLAPRGIGNMIALIVCGRLVAHIDPRVILALGFVAEGISTWMMAGFSLESGTWEVFWAGLLQGFGVGMMFLPLSLITFETLPVALRTDGSALFHLLRNIGSSIGISLAITLDPAQPRGACPLRLAVQRGPGPQRPRSLDHGRPARARPRDRPPGRDDRLRQ
jgi:DHA2 family multidrug resistance protein